MMLGLPGVTIIRSADEFGGNQTDNFTWKENDVSARLVYLPFTYFLVAIQSNDEVGKFLQRVIGCYRCNRS